MSAEKISATITWAVVTSISHWIMWSNGGFSPSYLLFSFLVCCVYFALWCLITREHKTQGVLVNQRNLAIVLYFVIIVLYFLIPVTFIAIFMVIFSSITLYFMSFRQALFISPLLALPVFFIFTFYWQQNVVIINTLLFWTFNIFALVMVNTSIREREARLEAQLTTRQLEATQALLNEAVKQGERVRIARNIHDLLGHHLTALTINLQVASRKSEGEVKDSVEQCHQLAKLLLSDVREAVSDIRDKSKLDLETSIRSMLDKLPQLSLHLDIDGSIQIEDIEIADAIVKSVQESITNTLKHANGSALWVSLRYKQDKPSANDIGNADKHIQVNISNNGNMPKQLIIGNGLNGIKERLMALKGSAVFLVEATKFTTQLLIPENQHD